MQVVFRAVAAVLILLIPTAAALAVAPPPPQFVIISFDGAHDLAQWQRSRELAARTGARFTYFLSCVFLLSKEARHAYKPPRGAAGSSNVGFAQSSAEVAGRLAQIRFAASEGHEIASHGCGHFDGKAWSKADWLAEFDAFDTILADAYVNNGLKEPSDWQTITGLVGGFRAPYLSTSPALYSALAEHGFHYDASGVSREPAVAGRQKVRRFALPQIPEGPSARRVLAMDYNFYVRHSGGFERPSEAARFEERTFEALMAAFDREHDGGRIPLQVGFHFTLMNDGAYWRALERFAKAVCVRADVRCVSYQAYLDETAAPLAAAAGG